MERGMRVSFIQKGVCVSDGKTNTMPESAAREVLFIRPFSMAVGVSAISSFMYTCLPEAVVKRAYGGLGGVATEPAGAVVEAAGCTVELAGRAVLVGAAVGTAVGVGLVGAAEGEGLGAAVEVGWTVGRIVAVGEGGAGVADAGTGDGADVAVAADVGVAARVSVAAGALGAQPASVTTSAAAAMSRDSAERVTRFSLPSRPLQRREA